MATIHTISRSWTNGSRSIPNSIPITAVSENNLDWTVNTGVTNQLQAFVMTIANMQSLYILSNTNVTIKTNSSGSPANTINLLANVPLVWQTGGYYTNLFTVDVTAIYLTNSSGQQATIRARFLSA